MNNVTHINGEVIEAGDGRLTVWPVIRVTTLHDCGGQLSESVGMYTTEHSALIAAEQAAKQYAQDLYAASGNDVAVPTATPTLYLIVESDKQGFSSKNISSTLVKVCEAVKLDNPPRALNLFGV